VAADAVGAIRILQELLYLCIEGGLKKIESLSRFVVRMCLFVTESRLQYV
jgi:hypothetical protein